MCKLLGGLDARSLSGLPEPRFFGDDLENLCFSGVVVHGLCVGLLEWNFGLLPLSLAWYCISGLLSRSLRSGLRCRGLQGAGGCGLFTLGLLPLTGDHLLGGLLSLSE